MIKYLLITMVVGLFGCGDNEISEPMHSPVCDSNKVFFVTRCGLSNNARCKLTASAPSDTNTDCSVVVLSSTTGEASYLECVDKCE